MNSGIRRVLFCCVLLIIGLVIYSLFAFHGLGGSFVEKVFRDFRSSEPSERDKKREAEGRKFLSLFSEDFQNEKTISSIQMSLSKLLKGSESRDLIQQAMENMLYMTKKTLYRLKIVEHACEDVSKKYLQLQSSLSMKPEGESQQKNHTYTTSTVSQKKAILEATMNMILNSQNWKGVVTEPVVTSNKCFLFGIDSRAPPTHIMDMDFFVTGSSSMGYSHVHYDTREPAYRYKHCDWNEKFSSVQLMATNGSVTIPVDEAPLSKLIQLRSRYKQLRQMQNQKKRAPHLTDIFFTGIYSQQDDGEKQQNNEISRELEELEKQIQASDFKLQFYLEIDPKKCVSPFYQREIVFQKKRRVITESILPIDLGITSFEVKCNGPLRNHANFFMTPPASVLNNFLHRGNLEQTNAYHGRFNVIMLFFDAASRVHFRRMYPSVTKWLDERTVSGNPNSNYTFSTFDFRFVNTVGHSSEDTQSYLFLGGECKRTCKSIWDDFKSQGYMTSYTEFSMFKFSRQTRPDILFDQTSHRRLPESLGYLSKNPGCIGHLFTEQHQEEHLRHLLKFQRASGISQFSVTNYDAFHDVTIQGPTRYEDSFHNLLQYLQNEDFLEDTVVVITSDHGSHLTTYSQQHFAGHMEHYNSLFEMIVPNRLKDVAPQFWENLKLNRHRYITLNDIYATVRHFAYLSREITQKEPPNPPPPLKNIIRYDLLAQVVPESRTCRDAGIKEEMCICRTQI